MKIGGDHLFVSKLSRFETYVLGYVWMTKNLVYTLSVLILITHP